MPARDPRQEARQHGKFAGEQGLEDPALGLFQDRLKLRRLVADLPPDLIERRQAIAVDQHMGDCIHPFVAGGAVHTAKPRQPFVLIENFLDHDVERIGIVLSRLAK